MDRPFTLEFHGSYIHITHPPGFVASPENVEETWTSLAAICDRYECRNVLVETSKMHRRLDTMDAFESGRQLAQINPPISVALCFHDYEFDELSKFFKTVAQNRGVRVEFFSDAGKAREWLGVDRSAAKDNS